MQIIKRKELVRKMMIDKRAAIDPKDRSEWNNAVNKRLQELIARHNPQVIHTYLPLRNEIDIKEVVRDCYTSGLKVVCPKALPDGELEHYEMVDIKKTRKGAYGTRYPAGNLLYNGPIDLIIVPGLAFDKDCNRLGYGGGYYDRFLKEHTESIKVAVAYDFQIMENLPRDKHDICLSLVITPEKIIGDHRLLY